MKKRALLSVYNREKIKDFAENLIKCGFEIIAYGDTYDYLKQENVEIIPVNSEKILHCIGGQIKNICPELFAGIMADRSNLEHINDLKDLEIEPIDVVVVNLPDYDNISVSESIKPDIETISIMRAAAGNYNDVAVIISPDDYEMVISQLAEKGEISTEDKLSLACKVFDYTCRYDCMYAAYMRNKAGIGTYPNVLNLSYKKICDLKNGENVHQTAAYYKNCVPEYSVLFENKDIMYNSVCDIAEGLKMISDFENITVVVFYNNSLYGAGTGNITYDALLKALRTDSTVVSDATIVTNGVIDRKTALEIVKNPTESVIATDYDDEAFEILSQKENIRIIKFDNSNRQPKTMSVREIYDGILVESTDNKTLGQAELQCVTQKMPEEAEKADLDFAFKCAKHMKTNAAVIVKNGQTLGLSQDNPLKFRAIENALNMAGEAAKGAILATDDVIDTPECLRIIRESGISAIIEPGGSIKDQELIDCCNENGIALMLANIKHIKL